ncbi:TPA: hypothetical protein NEG48_001514 [Elizabethkingia anophelis]|nr:hypothetical protein [Elizabethkingia anophelis]
MKTLIPLFLFAILFSCCEPMKEGYCVGKKFIPAHNESRSHLIGKTWYNTTEHVPDEYIVYFANNDRTTSIKVDSIAYTGYTEGKLYKLK